MIALDALSQTYGKGPERLKKLKEIVPAIMITELYAKENVTLGQRDFLLFQ